MEDNTDRPVPGVGPERDEGEQLARAERLVARLAQLRGQLDVVAPQDQARGREAIEKVREAQERIATLEAMLGSAREREHELTSQLVRGRAQITEYEARLAELNTIATRVASAEEARRRAEEAATEHEQALAAAQTHLDALRGEAEALRIRRVELEADLRAVADEMAAATIARAEAARLERERNEARERASTERRLAAADRIRASEAELRATELRAQLGAAERRIVQLANRAREPKVAASLGVGDEASEIEPFWIELQRTNAEPMTADEPGISEPSTSAADAPGAPEASAVAGPDPDADEHEVIDLTVEDEGVTEAHDSADTNGSDDAPSQGEGSWASSQEEGLLGRLLHGRRRS